MVTPGPMTDGGGARVPNVDKLLPLATGDETLLNICPKETTLLKGNARNGSEQIVEKLGRDQILPRSRPDRSRQLWAALP